jgi:hypothetical protein
MKNRDKYLMYPLGTKTETHIAKALVVGVNAPHRRWCSQIH